MKDKIFGIVKNSAIYSFGNIALKGMGVITLPIFTNTNNLSFPEYGLYALLDTTISILAELLTLGQANSVVYFNNKSEFENKKKSVFFTITLLVVIVNLAFVLVAGFSGNSLLSFIHTSENLSVLIPLIVITVFLRSINTVFNNKLRADEKSVMFTAITIVKIIAFIGLVFLTVVHMKLRVYGVILSFTITETLVCLVQLPSMLKGMTFSFDKDIVKSAIYFGFPLVLSSIGIQILNVSDRYLIEHYLNLESVGSYDFAYRIAGVVYMLLILPFHQALLPAAFKIYGQPGDKRYYSKIMTYMFFIAVWGGFALSVFSSEFILVFGNKGFLGIRHIVPIIILAYIYSSARSVAAIGMILEKRTFHLGTITIAAGILNILLNIIFIPIYGILAAAYSTLISFFLFYYVTKYLSNRFYKIPYEEYKIIISVLVGAVLYFVFEQVTIENYFFSLLVKLTLIAVYPFLLYPFGFYEKIEIETMKKSLKVIKNPAELAKNFKNLLN